MSEDEYQLRAPVGNEELRAMHAIRRKVLFENRGKREDYIENHPDDSKPENHPLVLLYKNVVIGVVRLDISDGIARLRRMAIQDDLQRLGHGRVLVRLAEVFAKAEGCKEMRSNAAVEAVGFYDRCGYERDPLRSPPANAVAIRKSLM
jgi:GNAT superfamily N-acetyltransferase